MSQHETQSVAIDGHRIKVIREEKRLTQLYVAKVVGVTTDTVSRWENNRYPTIRRDNALNLAEALEVPLDEILKLEDETVSEVVEKRSSKLWIVALAFVLMFSGGVWLLKRGAGSADSLLHAERFQPRYAAPGSRILVRLQIVMEKPLKGVIVREQFPEGLKLLESVPAVSSIGNRGTTARWMLRNPAPHTTIAYLLQVDPAKNIESDLRIIGEVIANPDGQRSSVPINTEEGMTIAPLHWADTDGNQVVDDMEILEISDLFEESDKFGHEWEVVEELWDAGGYRWAEEEARFIPRSKE